jgi:hypothetical protein
VTFPHTGPADATIGSAARVLRAASRTSASTIAAAFRLVRSAAPRRCRAPDHPRNARPERRAEAAGKTDVIAASGEMRSQLRPQRNQVKKVGGVSNGRLAALLARALAHRQVCQVLRTTDELGVHEVAIVHVPDSVGF